MTKSATTIKYLPCDNEYSWEEYRIAEALGLVVGHPIPALLPIHVIPIATRMFKRPVHMVDIDVQLNTPIMTIDINVAINHNPENTNTEI